MARPGALLEFRDRTAWRAWLLAHHATDREAWVVHRKHDADLDLMPLADGVEEALCFGWIDGRLQPMDDRRYALRYAPRRPDSVWSARNVARVERLTREGRMTDAGLAVAAAARRDGRWAAALARERIDVPRDLREALDAAGAWDAFDAQTPSAKRLALHWVETAVRDATRKRRIERIVAALRTDGAT